MCVCTYYVYCTCTQYLYMQKFFMPDFSIYVYCMLYMYSTFPNMALICMAKYAKQGFENIQWVPQLFSSSSRSQQLTAAIQTITKPTSQRIVSNRNSHSNNGLSHLLIKWNASILLTRVQQFCFYTQYIHEPELLPYV